MRHLFIGLTLAAIFATAIPSAASAQEIIVTLQRRGPSDNVNGTIIVGIVPAQRPIVTLRRNADYVVQAVRLTGDARDATVRKGDIDGTLRNMIAGADKAGVELATGDYIVEPLTLANYGNLSYTGDGRPDTSVTTFLVKVRLMPGMDLAAAKAKIARFVGSVGKVGRSSLMITGEPTLSVVNPDQYRGAIADLIAADAAAMTARFGPAYGVEVAGLDRPVEWTRAGTLDVFLYLPAAYTVTRR